VSSALTAHTLPANTLAWGAGYSVEVQIRDPRGEGAVHTSEAVWVHTNQSPQPAPTRQTTPSVNHKTPVTLAWTAPTVLDGDAVTYDVEHVFAGATATYAGIEETSLDLGLCPVGSHTWRVRAVDEHGLASAWTTYGSFSVSFLDTAPVATLVPQRHYIRVSQRARYTCPLCDMSTTSIRCGQGRSSSRPQGSV
jgi:hypothetical protein